MATGRMLKKNISTSRRLSELKNDTNRLIYTWILPFLDVKGRFSADPMVIKGLIFPRLKGLTPKKIELALKDMEKIELIKLFENDSDKYLEYRRFGDFQTLRYDRESKSQINYPTLKERGEKFG